MRGKIFTGKILIFSIIFMSNLLMNGCKKSDIALVTNNSVGNREGAVGKVFDHYPHFITRTWTAETDKQGHHLVVFIGGLNVKKLLSAASTDLLS